MKYKVEGCIIPDANPQQTVIAKPISKWYEAESHFEAAAMFILENPKVNDKTILVVGEDYSLGSYPLDNVKWKADYLCGLRW